MMTTRSPSLIYPAFFASSTAASNSSSVSSFSGSNRGLQPHSRFNCLHTLAFTLQLMMGQEGLYFATFVAVKPDMVTVMMALACRSMAVVQVA